MQTYPTLYESVLISNPIIPPVRPQEVINTDQFLENGKIGADAFLKAKVLICQKHEEYFDKKWDAESHNRTCYQWLLDQRNTHKDDVEKSRKIGQKIVQFAKTIKETLNPYRALHVDVSKEIVKDQEVSNWQD